jgi:hypothetical protein
VKDFVVVIRWGPRNFFVYDKSVENVLEKAEDTASLAADFVDTKPSGL